MKIILQVKPGSKQNKIEKIDDTHYKIWVSTLAEKGKANEKIRELLSDFFKISKSKIIIVSGLKSHQKIIEID